MTTPLRIVRDDERVVRISEEAATGMVNLIDAQRREIERLQRQNEMLDVSNTLVTQENERLRKQVAALQPQVFNLTRKLAAYHESQRTPEQSDSLADQIEYHRNHE